jgi:hypothetical protein
MRIIETAGFRRLTQAQDMGGGGAPGAPPPQVPKKKKKRKPLDEPIQFDNSSEAPKQDDFINPIRRSL